MNPVVHFDNLCAKIGKSKKYQQVYWWYKTQDTYFSTGLGKLFIPLQFSALFGNMGLILIVIEKFVDVPQVFYKMLGIFVAVLFFLCLFFGRFLDKSHSLHIEQEWGRRRDPLTKQIRKQFKAGNAFKHLKGGS